MTKKEFDAVKWERGMKVVCTFGHTYKVMAIWFIVRQIIVDIGSDTKGMMLTYMSIDKIIPKKRREK